MVQINTIHNLWTEEYIYKTSVAMFSKTYNIIKRIKNH